MRKFLKFLINKKFQSLGMSSFNCAQKMFTQIPKYSVTRNVSQSPSIYLISRTIKIPARYELLKQAASDRLLLNWFNDALGKAKNAILENWESAGLRKSRKTVDSDRRSATAKARKEFDQLSRTKNKAQRHLAENWDTIRRANSKNNQNLVDSIKKSATSTVDEVSKSVKEKGMT